MAQAEVFPRGDTFDLPGEWVDGAGPVDITGGTFECQLRREDTGELVADLDFTIVDGPAGLFRLTALDTLSWPVTRLVGDCRLITAGGFRQTSERFVFEVVEPETTP